MSFDSVKKCSANEYKDNNRAAADKCKSSCKKIEAFVLLCAASIILCLILCQVKHVKALAGSEKAFNIEGVPLESQAYIFEPCILELSLMDKDSCTDLSVLVNGNEAAMFTERKIVLELKEGDVVELDASGLIEAVRVQATYASPNIKNLLDKKMTVFDGINRFAVIGPAKEN